ncbi:MAG TPA: DNA polymerase Y family protein, partial [Microthrixaceae bacterium]|nr:DNA polymerase Y family protein [Microthrixaceae bacterium]
MEESVRTLSLICGQWSAFAVGRPPDVPLAVMRANRVVSNNAAAQQHGVSPGLRRREAQARCPSIELHDHDEQRDAWAFERVLHAMEDLVPRIEVLESGHCLFPSQGPSRFHGGDRRLAALVKAGVRDALAASTDRSPAERSGAGKAAVGSTAVGSTAVGSTAVSSAALCPVGIGVADGPRTASLAARESLERGEPVLVPRGASAAFLSPLPIERLDHTLDRDLIDVFRRLGLRTIGRFAALSAADVSARFGAVAIRAHRLANGVDTEPPVLGDIAVDLKVSASLDPPADRVDRAAFMAKVLADDLHGQLSSRGLACSRILVVAETETGDRIERLWRHSGTFSSAAVAQRVRWQLEGWLGLGKSLNRCEGG